MTTQLSLADRIRQARDFRCKPVEMPEWDCTVYVRSLRLRDARVFQEVSTRAADGVFTTDEMVKIVAVSLCDENGARLFDDDHIGELAEKDLESIRKLFYEAVAIIGLTKEAITEEKKT